MLFPDEGSFICPPGKSMIFTKRKQKKIELVFIPGADERSREANRPTLPPSEVDVRIRFLAGGLGSAE